MKPKAVGIYNKEIFIANFNEDGKIIGFDVLRPVTQEMLDDLRNAGTYEAFPCEDESGLEYLTENEIKQADNFLLDTEDIEVGTWECSGWYAPTDTYHEDGCDFKKFDYVFDLKLAKQYYKSLKK